VSSYTTKKLADNTLIGQTVKRGKAWWWRASEDGDESNHYEGPIPVEDVIRRLFNFNAIVVPSYSGKLTRTDDGEIQYDHEGKPIVFPDFDPDRVYVVADDNDHRFYNATPGYKPHQYHDWLIGRVGGILGDDLSISSAGLLDERGTAWVEISVPENLNVAGVEIRPNLLATTSHTGKLSTTYKRTITSVVCDNTYDAAMAEKGSTIKYRHTKNSSVREIEAREALQIISATGDATVRAIEEMTDTKINGGQWELLLKTVVPSTGTQKGKTQAENVREAIDRMYQHDDRVAPWNGTAFGAFQAWSTYNTHERRVRGKTDRAERNMWEAIDGSTGKRDQIMLDALAQLTAGTLREPELVG
jgi:phage/plasmid-like protein (TIGR03299 family)